MSPPVNPLEPLPSELIRIEGIHKLRRAIHKEITSPCVNEKSSNLPHLLSILKCIQITSTSDNQQLPSAVLKPFNFSGGRTGRLIVDIVSSDGDCWYKVSARNPKALNLLAAGGGGFGQKSIVDHICDYLECAKENPCIFKAPKITAIFTSGIGESLAKELECLDVTVQGERIPDSELGVHPRIKIYNDSSCLKEFRKNVIQDLPVTDDFINGCKNPSLEGVTKLNLDISTLLATTSNLTNGHSNVVFKKSILGQQAEAERERPQKPILDKVFQGRDLYCCETALKEFRAILSTVGGPEEKERATELLKRITVVPDQFSERTKALYVSGSIKSRSLIIFGTGDAIEAVTITANSGFVRSAKTQGVDLAAFIHESRALTEQKQNLPHYRLN